MMGCGDKVIICWEHHSHFGEMGTILSVHEKTKTYVVELEDASRCRLEYYKVKKWLSREEFQKLKDIHTEMLLNLAIEMHDKEWFYEILKKANMAQS